MAQFILYRLNFQELELTPDAILQQLHLTTYQEDNPIMEEVIQVYEALPQITNIQGGYIIYDAIELFPKEGKLKINDITLSPSKQICFYMAKAERIALFICTAGKGFTDYAKQYNKVGEYLKSYIVDLCGSLVVEKAMEHIQRTLEHQMNMLGLKITNRYSPGYCNWPVSDQKLLFSLLPQGQKIVSLTPSCLMVPIKSVSGIIGIGQEVKKSAYACEICNNPTCTFRKVKAKQLNR